ncbi:hypothetical protein Sme01_10970 [Sphaerisporangium melleum]|uniref:Uncharacterized protein n=1 Tax=Sphaerisporangium melleum TaxID=321316 RepID=A0A917QSW3_9ACTN|nr:hypothetical protein GCM10007964_06650 [Sphaerisporangium melleum]GII68621.1 hypothetical protein Sme01_10970 [Sphaerisporangium melleum]
MGMVHADDGLDRRGDVAAGAGGGEHERRRVRRQMRGDGPPVPAGAGPERAFPDRKLLWRLMTIVHIGGFYGV